MYKLVLSPTFNYIKIIIPTHHKFLILYDFYYLLNNNIYTIRRRQSRELLNKCVAVVKSALINDISEFVDINNEKK